MQRLQDMYEAACQSDAFFADGIYETAEEDLEEMPSVPSDGGNAEACVNLLEDVGQNAGFHHADPEEKAPESVINESLEEDLATDDRDEVLKLTAMEAPEEPFSSEQGRSPSKSPLANHLPATLREALDLPKCSWNALFRFAIKIRNSSGGCDTGFLKSARNCRRAAKGLSWFQLLGFVHMGQDVILWDIVSLLLLYIYVLLWSFMIFYVYGI